MSWKVQSSRLAWPEGTVLGADDLAGCNIAALVEGGHLSVYQQSTPAPEAPKRKRMPVEPVPDDTADEPEEQE
jgi:hypothetical protein